MSIIEPSKTEKSFEEKLSYQVSQGDITEIEAEREVLNFDKPWWRVSHLLTLNLLILIPASAGSLNGFDGFLVNSLQIMKDWKTYMGNPTDARLGGLTAGPPIGYLSALWFARVSSDKYGRKKTLLIGSIITTIGVIIQACSNGYACFMVSRIIVGWGLAFYFISAPAWIAELSFPTHRSSIVALFNGSAYFGGLIATWVSYGTMEISSSWQWRIPCLSQLAITVPHLFLLWFVPESPRYLVSINETQKAREILMKYHGGNDESRSGSFIDFELDEIKVAIEREKLETNNSYMEYFRTRGNFHRFCICIFMGFLQYNIGLFAVTYYLNPVLTTSGITSDRQQMLVAGGITIFNCVVAYLPTLFVDKINRRTVFLVNMVMLFLVYFVFVVLSGINTHQNFENPAIAKGIIGTIFLCYLFYDIGFLGTLLVYITEIMPFSLRSSGIMLYVISGQSSVIFNGFVTPVAMDHIGWKFYIVYCCTIIACFIFIFFFFPETKGYYLEEVAWVFDGKSSKITHTTQKKRAMNNINVELENIDV